MFSSVARCAAAAILIPFFLSGCRDPHVAITYAYEEGQVRTTRLTAEASAEWTFADGATGSGSYRMTADVEETVSSTAGEGAVLDVVIRPLSVDEDGLLSPGEEIRSFSLRVDATGRVVRVLSVGGSPAADLTPEETAFIGSFRPPLPPQPVTIGDAWQSQGSAGASMFDQAVTEGRLVGLDRIGGIPHADIVLTADGPAVWRTALPQGEASLTGSIHSEGRATVDLGDGELRSAGITISGRFDVRVAHPDGTSQPLAGVLDLRLGISVRRVN